MFDMTTAITMWDGTKQAAGYLASLGPAATLLVATKKGAGAGYGSPNGDGKVEEGCTNATFEIVPGEYVTVTTKGGRSVKCAPRARICLAGGGFAYASECNGTVLDTESGPDEAGGPDTTGEHCELVTVSLAGVHAVLANGIWFLTD